MMTIPKLSKEDAVAGIGSYISFFKTIKKCASIMLLWSSLTSVQTRRQPGNRA